jgi:hypothetical protein
MLGDVALFLSDFDFDTSHKFLSIFLIAATIPHAMSLAFALAQCAGPAALIFVVPALPPPS